MRLFALSLALVACSSEPAATPPADAGADSIAPPGAFTVAAGEVAEAEVVDGVARFKVATPGANERFIVVIGSTRFDRTTGSVPYSLATDAIEGDAPATLVKGCSINAWTAPPPSETAPAGTAPAVGTKRKLWLGSEEIDAEVIKTSSGATVWADRTPAHPANLDAAFVDEFLKDFDNVILPRERAVFGVESDADKDGHIGLIFSPLTYNSAVAYFSGCDLQSFTGCPGSNKGEFLYLTPPDAIPPPYNTAAAIKEILAHELGHLIHFNRKTLRNALADQPDSAYMHEGLGALAQDVIGFQAGNLYVTKAGLESIEDFSLAEVLKDRARYDSKRDGPMRGGSYLFSRFLYDRAGSDDAQKDGTIANKGGPAFMRALLDHKASVTAAVAEVAKTTIEDVAMDFFTALAASNRDAAGGVQPQNKCFAYLPTVLDPITAKQRGADLFATFHGSKMSGPKLQPLSKPSGTIRLGGVELISIDATTPELTLSVTVDPEARARVRLVRVK